MKNGIVVLALLVVSVGSLASHAKSKEPMDQRRLLTDVIEADRRYHLNNPNLIPPRQLIGDQLTAAAALGLRVKVVEFVQASGTDSCEARIKLYDNSGRIVDEIVSSAGLLPVDCQ
jgi:hypothetical protein